MLLYKFVIGHKAQYSLVLHVSIICVWVRAHPYMCMCAGSCDCVCRCGGQSLMMKFVLCFFTSYFWERSLTGPSAFWSSRAASQRNVGILLVPLAHHWDYKHLPLCPNFHVGAVILTQVCTHASAESTLYTEPFSPALKHNVLKPMFVYFLLRNEVMTKKYNRKILLILTSFTSGSTSCSGEIIAPHSSFMSVVLGRNDSEWCLTLNWLHWQPAEWSSGWEQTLSSSLT